MENTVKLQINHYIGDNFDASRQVFIIITEECLKDYLKATDDERTVKQFLDTYDSDEAEIVYEYANDDGRILSEDITYCDDFIEKYEEFIKHTEITKEDYYFDIYA